MMGRTPLNHLDDVTPESESQIVERALGFVAEFQGDGRAALNCYHAEALAREIHRLREREAELARLRSEIEQVAQKWRTYTESYSQWNLAADELDEVLAALARGGE